MKTPTNSEELFAAFCDELGITCEPIPMRETKTPDFIIKLEHSDIIVEIKQLEKNKSGDIITQELFETGIAAYISQTEKRVARDIRKAGEQLRSFSTGQPTAVLLFDNESVEGIDFIDIKNAMFGVETIGYNPRTGQVSPIFAGKGKCMSANHNTSISVVCLLTVSEVSTLTVFHNHFARRPVDPDWLRHERIKHFKLADAPYEWVDI